jgi:serine protease Do
MKVLKILGVLVAVAGLAALGMIMAPSAFGQVRPGRPMERSEKVPFAFFNEGSRIGAAVRDLEPAEADRQKLTGGAVVEDVRPDSPAARAGLRRADVIVTFDGEQVRSVRQFTRLVQETPSGRSVKATIVRDGQRSDIQLTPTEDRRAGVVIDGERIRERVEDFAARLPEFNLDMDIDPMGMSRGRLGVTVSALGDQLAAYFGAKEGVLITAVADGSAAQRAGLKAGDVITAINNERVASPGQLTRALRSVNDDAELTVGIVRDRKEMTVKAKLESRQPRSARPI